MAAHRRPDDGLLTLDELTKRVGMSVRNVRFYTTKGLVPPPIRRGRSGYYSADHVARLELVQELQSHGFTLAAIERYVAGIPDRRHPRGHRAARAPCSRPGSPTCPSRWTTTELEAKAGRALSDEDVATLQALGSCCGAAARRTTSPVNQLAIGVGLLDLGFPREVAVAAAAVYQEHGEQMAKELYEVIRDKLAPLLRATHQSEHFREVMERLKPLSVGGLVTAYESAVDPHRAAASPTTDDRAG